MPVLDFIIDSSKSVQSLILSRVPLLILDSLRQGPQRSAIATKSALLMYSHNPDPASIQSLDAHLSAARLLLPHEPSSTLPFRVCFQRIPFLQDVSLAVVLHQH